MSLHRILYQHRHQKARISGLFQIKCLKSSFVHSAEKRTVKKSKLKVRGSVEKADTDAKTDSDPKAEPKSKSESESKQEPQIELDTQGVVSDEKPQSGGQKRNTRSNGKGKAKEKDPEVCMSSFFLSYPHMN